MKQSFSALISRTTEDACKVLDEIIGARRDDIKDWDNLPNMFVSGRSSKRAVVPATSSDIASTDKNGDVLLTANYVYYLINGAWRRTALGAF